MTATVDAAKCKKCNHLSYPTHFYCPKCGATEFEPVPVEGQGTLMTFTRSYALSLDYEVQYITLGIVEMDMGVRATGQLDIEAPKIGMRVKASIGPVREIDGREINGLRFSQA